MEEKPSIKYALLRQHCGKSNCIYRLKPAIECPEVSVTVSWGREIQFLPNTFETIVHIQRSIRTKCFKDKHYEPCNDCTYSAMNRRAMIAYKKNLFCIFSFNVSTCYELVIWYFFHLHIRGSYQSSNFFF